MLYASIPTKTNMNIPRFHLAFPVHNLEEAKVFYHEILGCEIGRYSDQWMDFNLYGHQIVAHLSPQDCILAKHNEVDGDDVPSRHFGVILPWEKWSQLRNVLIEKKVNWLIEPRIRFKNTPGEQGTFFINDPSNNSLEFKTFKNNGDIFRSSK